MHMAILLHYINECANTISEHILFYPGKDSDQDMMYVIQPVLTLMTFVLR